MLAGIPGLALAQYMHALTVLVLVWVVESQRVVGKDGNRYVATLVGIIN